MSFMLSSVVTFAQGDSCTDFIGGVLMFQDDCHADWVSCVRFSPNSQNPVIVSCGMDRIVKVSPGLMIAMTMALIQ